MIALTPDATVGEIAAELPGAAELFRRAGKQTLAEAAARRGIGPQTLLDGLRALAEAAGHETPAETDALIEHILSRYHQTHRAELDWLIPLAEKVERVHGDHAEAPRGLAAALTALRAELDSHMMKEERVLFPMMRQGGHAMIAHPIAAMRHEHHTATDLLRGVEHATGGLALPEGACRSWAALCAGLRKFADDLVAHIHLENDMLFPRFETA